MCNVDMDEVKVLHDKAMEYADKAFIARRAGVPEAAANCFLQAAWYEKEAALRVLPSSVEPTRSVLFRSAGTLALDSGQFGMAELLIAIGLEGNPPNAIRAELEEVRARLEKVRSYV